MYALVQIPFYVWILIAGVLYWSIPKLINLEVLIGKWLERRRHKRYVREMDAEMSKPADCDMCRKVFELGELSHCSGDLKLCGPCLKRYLEVNRQPGG